MSEDALQLGALHRLPDGVEGVLQRRFAHPREAVWPMLVEPEKFAQWLAPGTLEPRPGGAVRIAFHDSGTVIDSVLTAFEPPRLLAYSWSSGAEPARPLRWELADADGATRLTLRVRVPAGKDAAKACAGFEGTWKCSRPRSRACRSGFRSTRSWPLATAIVACSARCDDCAAGWQGVRRTPEGSGLL